MRYLLAASAIILMGAGCASRPVAPSAGPNLELEQTGLERKTVIKMTDQGFTPSEIGIGQGESVTFTNAGTEDHWPASANHPTHDRYPAFDPKRGIPPGESWTFTFTQAGSWAYHDHLNSALRGKVVVTP